MVQPTIETTGRIDWDSVIPAEDWKLYKSVIDKFREIGIRFAIGGGLAFSEYSGRARNTKDIDLYIFPCDREKAIAAVLSLGFEDYYEKEPYDRSWIFRSCQADVIVDIMWTAPNHRMTVDPRWLTRGRDACIHGSLVKFLPPEELIWAKIYVLQRDRCDWPDLLNILHAAGPMLDWRHLVDRVGKDAPLLAALLSTYRWMCPERALKLPVWIWDRLGLRPWPEVSDETCTERAPLLDSRDWLGPKETL